MEFPDDLKYSREHEWVLVEGTVATIGITAFAEQQLGDVVFVELPEVGDAIVRGEPFGVIESVKAVSDLYAPLSGEVLEVNEALGDAPEKVNQDCYGEGWILVLRPSDTSEELLDAAAYARHVAERED
jgi:glycine cleavage system H protein